MLGTFAHRVFAPHRNHPLIFCESTAYFITEIFYLCKYFYIKTRHV